MLTKFIGAFKMIGRRLSCNILNETMIYQENVKLKRLKRFRQRLILESEKIQNIIQLLGLSGQRKI
jgi:hypothetical protein